MLITINDYLMGRVTFNELSPDEQANATLVVERINKFFEGYVWPLKKKVNDGKRRPQDAPKNGATKSTHYTSQGIDMDDDDAGTVWKYAWANRHRLAEIGLWMENPCWTHCDGMSWLHFQIVPPKSGNRFYVPSSRPNPNPKFWNGKYEASLNSTSQPK